MTHLSRRQTLSMGLGALATALIAPGTHAASTVAKPAKHCIVLFMVGGPSQFETWDPKPGRETGGELGTIPTSLSGVRISETLPGLAARADELAIIRSLSYAEGNHGRARYLMHTGYAPQGTTGHPSLGAEVAASVSQVSALPSHVAIGGPGHDAGFIGAQHSPFIVGDPRKPIRNVEQPPTVDAARLDRRMELWESLERDFARERPRTFIDGHEATVRQAIRMMRAPELEAFDLEQEPETMRARYGDTKFGAGCLMARRLVERGVRFVEVQMDGWDTHADNFDRVRKLSAALDPAMSALLDDLSASGLLEETLILWVGDFGRTPRINGRGGRDHYPRVANAVLAGGGIRGGQVIGATDADGIEVVERPLGVPDLFRTVGDPDGPQPRRGANVARRTTDLDGGRRHRDRRVGLIRYARGCVLGNSRTRFGQSASSPTVAEPA